MCECFDLSQFCQTTKTLSCYQDFVKSRRRPFEKILFLFLFIFPLPHKLLLFAATNDIDWRAETAQKSDSVSQTADQFMQRSIAESSWQCCITFVPPKKEKEKDESITSPHKVKICNKNRGAPNPFLCGGGRIHQRPVIVSSLTQYNTLLRTEFSSVSVFGLNVAAHLVRLGGGLFIEGLDCPPPLLSLLLFPRNRSLLIAVLHETFFERGRHGIFLSSPPRVFRAKRGGLIVNFSENGSDGRSWVILSYLLFLGGGGGFKSGRCRNKEVPLFPA